LSWRRQRSLNLALELADCCACGEAANVACRLMGSFCGQGGGEEEAGERRRHEAAAVSIGAVAGHAKAKAGFPWGRFARQPWRARLIWNSG